MTDEEKKNNPLYSDTAYDDAFRTIETKFDDILIPFVNYFFKENYDRSAVIKRMRNERFIEPDDKTVKKRITDSHFEIIYKGITKKYHLECESKTYDGSILVRLFEYDAQMALDDSESSISKLCVRFPYTGLLVLRGSDITPDNAEVVLETPEGSTKYHIPIIKESDFPINKIFEEQLYLLIPFYIFNFERELQEIDKDENRTEAIADLYRKIIQKLDVEVQKGRLSANSQGAIIEVTQRVVYKLTMKHEHVQKKVGDIMGGQVLDLQVFRAFDEGKAEGLAKGEEERKKLKDENDALRKEIELLKAGSK